MIQAAREFPEVQFCHATGTKAHTEGLDNFHNAFASIYEGRYLAGIAAGMKLNEMIEAGEITESEAKMGYVGAFTYAEVISGYTSFYLGAKSVCQRHHGRHLHRCLVRRDRREGRRQQAHCRGLRPHQPARRLHGRPTACEDAGVPNVSYNGSTVDACPNTFIVSSRINWEPYFEYMINCVVNGEAIAADWTGTIATGSVELSEVNEAAAAEGTVEAIEAAKAELEAGTLHVFDVNTFTVGGETKTSYMADVDTDPDYTPGYRGHRGRLLR